jgi:hypothetical protein
MEGDAASRATRGVEGSKWDAAVRGYTTRSAAALHGSSATQRPRSHTARLAPRPARIKRDAAASAGDVLCVIPGRRSYGRGNASRVWSCAQLPPCAPRCKSPAAATKQPLHGRVKHEAAGTGCRRLQRGRSVISNELKPLSWAARCCRPKNSPSRRRTRRLRALRQSRHFPAQADLRRLQPSRSSFSMSPPLRPSWRSPRTSRA